MTEILFCDLCNESVPEGDVEAGRAFRVKGRVVCAACDKAMRGERELSAPAVPGGPPPAPGALSPGAPASAHGAHPPHAGAQRASGVGAAVGLAAASIALTVVLGYWMDDQLKRLEQRSEQRVEAVQDTHAATRAQDEGRWSEIHARAATLESSLADGLVQQRERLDASLAEGARTAQELAAKVAAFERKLADLREPLGAVGRHDAELVALQGRYSELVGELDALAQQLADGLAARPAGADPAQPLAPLQPAWAGLLQQLGSDSVSERWQAIVALGETRDPAVVPHIVTALGDVDVFIRVLAARTLEELGSPLAIAPLIDALADAESPVRERAYLALQKLTKRDLPFDPQSEDVAERQRHIKAWRDWWDKERVRLGA